MVSIQNSILATDDFSGQFFQVTTKDGGLGEWRRYDKSHDDRIIRLFKSDSRVLALVEDRQEYF